MKHAALAAAMVRLMECGAGPFCYADAFAGYAWNPMGAGGEWSQGVRRVALSPGAEANHYVKTIGAPALTTMRYPGSSTIVKGLAAAAHRPLQMHLWDISDTAVADLRSAHEPDGHCVHHVAVTAMNVQALHPSLVLVDPPGVRGKGTPSYPSWSEIRDLLGTGVTMIAWLPVSPLCERGDHPRPAPKSEHLRREAIQVGLETSRVLYKAGGHLLGCQLFYRALPDVVDAIRRAVNEVAALARWPYPPATEQVLHEGPG